jgi:hypothetical protein
MARRNGQGLAIIAAAILVTSACTAAGSTSPSASPIPTTTGDFSPAPTAAATQIPSPSESLMVYAFTYNGEPGGHGGPPLLDLEAPIAIDYAVTRGCAFTIKVTFGVPDDGIEAARFSISAGTPTTSGTWPVRIKPGQYYIVGTETVGCPFQIEARRIAATASSPSPGPTPVRYYEVAKDVLIAGGHGGAPFMDLPADLQIDYDVTGTCHFGVSFGTITPVSGLPTLAVDVVNAEMTGTWLVTIPPGSYEPVPTEADGCTFHLSVHAPG